MESSDGSTGSSGHPCLWCGELTGSKTSYCSDICKEKFMAWLEDEPATLRGTRPPFWNIIRRSILERDNHQCQICGKREDLSVHHIIPLSAGGDSTAGNLRVLCHPCHQKEHGHPARANRKNRFRIRIRYQQMDIPASLFGDWIRHAGQEA